MAEIRLHSVCVAIDGNLKKIGPPNGWHLSCLENEKNGKPINDIFHTAARKVDMLRGPMHLHSNVDDCMCVRATA